MNSLPGTYLAFRDSKVNNNNKVNCPSAPSEHRAMKAYWGSGGTAPSIL